MNRYTQSSSNITTRYDGKRVLLTTRYPTIPTSQGDIYIITTSTDFLDTLAKKYYKDESLWWIIAQANSIKGTMRPQIGIQIRIPGNVESLVSNFYRANS